MKTPEKDSKLLNSSQKAEPNISLTPKIIDEPIYKSKEQPDLHQMKSHQEPKVAKVDGFVAEHRACPSEADADVDSAEPEYSPVYVIHDQNPVQAETPMNNQLKLNFYEGHAQGSKDEEEEVRLAENAQNDEQVEVVSGHQDQDQDEQGQ